MVADYEGRPICGTGSRVWHNEDLQSFTPLRFMPPELMGYQVGGRDGPDVFAVGDVNELLNRDMEGDMIGVARAGSKGLEGTGDERHALDCAQLTHWNVHDQRCALRRSSTTRTGSPRRGPLEDRSLRARVERLRPADREDEADPQHEAKDSALEERPARRLRASGKVEVLPADALGPARRRKFFGDYAFVPDYKSHPDKRQEDFFFVSSSAWRTASSPKTSFAKRWAGTTSATTPSKCSTAWSRSRPDRPARPAPAVQSNSALTAATARSMSRRVWGVGVAVAEPDRPLRVVSSCCTIRMSRVSRCGPMRIVSR